MEQVLHIERIARQCPVPLSIGHTDHVFYGKKLNDDGENIGDVTDHIRLGAPLQSMDVGQHHSDVSLIKTVECVPDFSQESGHIYSETMYYHKDNEYLIPFRTKIATGPNSNLRFNHIPSLSAARCSITGGLESVADARLELAVNLTRSVDAFKDNRKAPLREWLENEFLTSMDSNPFSELSFDSEVVQSFINRFTDQIDSTPDLYSPRDLKALAGTLYPLANKSNNPSFPILQSTSPLIYDRKDVRNALTHNTFDFKSFGTIPVNKLNRVLYNPKEFQDFCELFDMVPLTDINIDLVLNLDSEIAFYHEHLALNRFSHMSGHRPYDYTFELSEHEHNSLFRDFFHEGIITHFLDKIKQYHPDITGEIFDLIDYCSVKLKFIKTFLDEAAILIYAHDSRSDDPPLCGVYFDIAALSLAPMSVIPFDVN